MSFEHPSCMLDTSWLHEDSHCQDVRNSKLHRWNLTHPAARKAVIYRAHSMHCAITAVTARIYRYCLTDFTLSPSAVEKCTVPAKHKHHHSEGTAYTHTHEMHDIVAVKVIPSCMKTVRHICTEKAVKRCLPSPKGIMKGSCNNILHGYIPMQRSQTCAMSTVVRTLKCCGYLTSNGIRASLYIYRVFF